MSCKSYIIKRVILGAFIGAAIMMCWAQLSWYVFGWYKGAINRFENEILLSEEIQAHAPGAGVFLKHSDKRLFPGQATEEDIFLLAAIDSKGTNFYGPAPFTLAGISRFIICGILTYLLLKMRLKRYFSRVMFALGAGVFSALFGSIHQHVWWEFSLSWTGINGTGLLAMFFVTGLALAGITKTKEVEA